MEAAPKFKPKAPPVSGAAKKGFERTEESQTVPLLSKIALVNNDAELGDWDPDDELDGLIDD
jgi:hypothetical protein